MPKTAYTIQEAASEFSISDSVLRRAIRERKLVPHKPSGRPILFHEDVVAWIKHETSMRGDAA